MCVRADTVELKSTTSTMATNVKTGTSVTHEGEMEI